MQNLPKQFCLIIFGLYQELETEELEQFSKLFIHKTTAKEQKELLFKINDFIGCSLDYTYLKYAHFITSLHNIDRVRTGLKLIYLF